MAIHPARFSGRRPASSPRPGKRPSGFGRKIARILILLILVIGLGYAVKQAFILLQPLPNLPSQKAYPIATNSKDRTNLLLVRFDGEEVDWLSIVSFSASKSVLFLTIPADALADLAGERGAYRLSAAWKIGNLEGESGMNLLRDSVSRVLAIPIDGYVAADQAGWQIISNRYGSKPDQLLAALTSPVFLAQYLVTDPWPAGLATSLGRLELATDLSSLQGQSIRELSLEGTLVNLTVGGQTLPSLEADSFDGRVGLAFAEDSIAKAHPKVSITNASGIPGAAVELARYVHNLGGEVISVESAETHAKNSTIADHEGGNLANRLAPLIRAQVVRDRKTARADLEITIGENAQGVF